MLIPGAWGWRLVGVAAVVLLTRAPFLSAGFGQDFDGWLMADAARVMRATGEYSPSRRPGYPVTELLMTLAHRAGPLGMNGVSALACAACCVLATSLVRAAGEARALLAGALCAFPAVVYVASTSSLDYLVSLALFLGSVRLALSGRWRTAGVIMGLAAGARPANALLVLALIPLARRRGEWRQALRFGIVAVSVACACFVPVVRSLGLDYLRPALGAAPSLRASYLTITQETFGVLGFWIFALGFAFALVRLPAVWPGLSTTLRAVVQLLGLTFLLCVAEFLAMPYEAGYLIPAVFAMTLVIGISLPRRAMVLFACLAASVAFVDLPSWPAGPIIEDHRVRTTELAMLDDLSAAVDAVALPTLLVTGKFHSKVLYRLGIERSKPRSERLWVSMFLPGATENGRPRSAGYKGTYVPGMREWYERMTGVDITKSGLEPILER